MSNFYAHRASLQLVYKLKAEAEINFFFSSKHRQVIIPAPTDVHVILHSFSLFFSLSLSSLHLPLSLPLTFSSPTLSPPCLFISLTCSSPMGFSFTSSSPMGFFPLPFHLPWVFSSPLYFPN